MQLYTAKQGDTLQSIAEQTHTDLSILQACNPTARRLPLVPRQTILIPHLQKTSQAVTVSATPTHSLHLVREGRGNFISRSFAHTHSHFALEAGTLESGEIPYIPRLLLERGADYVVPLLSLSVCHPFLLPASPALAKIRTRGWRGCIVRLPSPNTAALGVLKLLRGALSSLSLSLFCRFPMAMFFDAPAFLGEALPYIDGIILDGGDPALFAPSLDVLTDTIRPRLRPYLYPALPVPNKNRTRAGCGCYGDYACDVSLACTWVSRLSYGGFGGLYIPKEGCLAEIYPLLGEYFTLQRGYETAPARFSP